jgi:hypothetical protein|tara:strand:- start:290 stop:523 length:234 start_codon:yes stop_codon:yes gene_type:complete
MKDNRIQPPEWFDGDIYKEGISYVTQKGELVELDALGASMYDLIKGYDFLNYIEKADRAHRWFRDNYPQQYKQLFEL